MSLERIHFITGKLANSALREILTPLAQRVGFEFTVQVLPISVAALLTPSWIAKRIEIPSNTDRIILPGYCHGDLSGLESQAGIPVERGPKDLRQLPEFFGQLGKALPLNEYSIEIIAEINHAPLQAVADVVQQARRLKAAGADVIDIGCVPGATCRDIGEYVQAVVDQGLRVSIDSLNADEIKWAVTAGAELVLSVNGSNITHAPDWGVEVVVIPNEISNIESLEPSIESLVKNHVPFRIDPILEPIGLGFARSLERYWSARARWPQFPLMMGIGNLTELTDVDSAGVNVLLLGICEELDIESVLTTQVINWSRSSVAECDYARRLVHYAAKHRVPPKNLSQQLVVTRDSRLLAFSESQIDELASNIKDHNYRILVHEDQIHLLGSGHHLVDTDPFRLFDQLAATHPNNLDPSHAFYLGYEMCKAMTAIQLGKNYVQDEALNWGHLTVPEENRHRLSKKFRPERKA